MANIFFTAVWTTNDVNYIFNGALEAFVDVKRLVWFVSEGEGIDGLDEGAGSAPRYIAFKRASFF